MVLLETNKRDGTAFKASFENSIGKRQAEQILLDNKDSRKYSRLYN